MKSSRFRISPKLALMVAGAAISIFVASQAFADFSLTDWLYVKPIILPSDPRTEGLAELQPDREVFRSSSPGLIDLRIIAGDGIEVPFKIEISNAKSQRDFFPISLTDTGHVPGRYTSFVEDLGRPGVLHNQIEFHTSDTNFRRAGTVEASNDGVTWATIAEQQVYDFTVREIAFTSRDTRLSYPENTARYLRVRIADEGEGAIAISGASVFFTKETPAREASWPVTVLNASRDAGRRLSLVDLDLAASGLPTYRLAVQVPDVNFYREVDLQASSDLEEWLTLASRRAIYAYDTPKFVGNSLVITYPETTSRYFRLVIHDEDNPPINVNGVDVWGLQRRLLFSANPDQSYKLYYGNVEARRPSYDIERILPYLETEDLPQASLGPQAVNPEFVELVPPPPPELPLSEQLPWLLPTAVGLAGIVVAFLLFGVLRKARKLLPPPPE